MATKSPPSATNVASSAAARVDRAQQRDRVDEFAGRFRPRVDLALARFVARAQSGEPVLATVGEAFDAGGEADEEIAGVADRRDVGAAIEPRLARAAVGGDQRRRAADMAAVIEAEVAGRAGEQHAIGFAQRLAALVQPLQRMIAAEQAARHAGEKDRRAEPRQSFGDARRVFGADQRLAADDDQRPLGRGEPRRRRFDLRLRRRRRDDRAWRRRRRLAGLGEQAGGVALEIEPQQAVGDRSPFARRVAIPVANGLLVVEQVDRAFDEDRARHAFARDGERFGDRRREVAHPPHALRPFDERRDDRPLVDVLQRAASLQRGRRGAADQQQRRLRQLARSRARSARW